jgi:uncharacterized membrane protein
VPFVVSFHAKPSATTGFVPGVTVPFNVAVVCAILVAATVVTATGVIGATPLPSYTTTLSSPTPYP